MKALVVGGTGPTGPFIVNGLIKRGYDVTVLHGGQHEAEFMVPVEHIHTDPHFQETLGPALANRSYDLVVATYGRIRIVADVVKGKTRRLITVGGASWAPGTDPRWGPLGAPMFIPEDSPPNDNPAATGKLAYAIYTTEQAVLQAHRDAFYEITHFHWPMVYGPNSPANPDWSVVRRILDGRRQIIIAAGEGVRNRGYGENAAHALLLAVDNPKVASGQVYNVRDRALFTRRREVEHMAKVLKRDVEIVEMPPSLVSNVYRGLGGQLSQQAKDITKLRKDLGYDDVVPVAEALRRTVESLVKNPPERGGEIERQIGDPFAYEAEDELIGAYAIAMAQLQGIEFPESTGGGHMYRHPKKPGEAWAPPPARP